MIFARVLCCDAFVLVGKSKVASENGRSSPFPFTCITRASSSPQSLRSPVLATVDAQSSTHTAARSTDGKKKPPSPRRTLPASQPQHGSPLLHAGLGRVHLLCLSHRRFAGLSTVGPWSFNASQLPPSQVSPRAVGCRASRSSGTPICHQQLDNTLTRGKLQSPRT